ELDGGLLDPLEVLGRQLGGQPLGRRLPPFGNTPVLGEDVGLAGRAVRGGGARREDDPKDDQGDGPQRAPPAPDQQGRRGTALPPLPARPFLVLLAEAFPPRPIILVFLSPAAGAVRRLRGDAALGPAVLVLLVGVGAGPGPLDRDGFVAVAA